MVSHPRLIAALRAATILSVAGFAAGCSSDVTRFAGLYTAAIPAAPEQQQVALAQPDYQTYPVQTYPQTTYGGVAAADSSGVLAPPAIDPTTTASISSPAPTLGSRVQSLKDRAMGALRPSANRFGPRPQASIGAGALAQPQLTAPTLTTNSPVLAQPALPTNVYPAAPVISAPAVSSAPLPAPDVDRMSTGTVPPRLALDTRTFGGWSSNGGTKVTVKQGETVYNLSRRFGVPANAILKVNGIEKAGSVQTGQELIIPTYNYDVNAPVSAPDNNPNTASARSSTGTIHDVALEKVPSPTAKPRLDPTTTASIAPAVPRDAERYALPKDRAAGLQGDVMPGDGRYVVKSGDTLSAIAARHGVKTSALMAANMLDKPDIRIGQALTIPRVDGTYVAGADGVDRNATGGRSTTVSSAKPASSGQDTTTTSSISRLEAKPSEPAPESTGVAGLRWPAQGRVITGFGASDNGKANDGIDIALPKGTPVKAAENGVVIYAGDGLSEFGNTVLIRHDDGMVTVYGHADKLNVTRNQKVRRGDVIALSGNSGQADQPKLHFEVRKNSTPVDPVKYLN